MSAETFEFKSEARQLLDLMIHSLYSHKEIFLRELISNASDAIDKLRFRALADASLVGDDTDYAITLETDAAAATLTIADNGIGLPEDRARLFEPYVTTRDEGTGLGLPIVKKIIEEHGGTLSLEDAPPFGSDPHCGAMAVIGLQLGYLLTPSETEAV